METMARWQQVSLLLPQCSYLYVLKRTSHGGTNRAHIVLDSSPQKYVHPTIYQGTPGREKRSNE